MASAIGVGEGRATPQLRVRLLGTVEIIHRGERLRAFDTPRLQRLLGLLVVRPELQHRARLAFELWPDSAEAQARTNLRKLLHEFRTALPDSDEFVEIDHDIVRWIPGAPAEIDVVRFGEALATGDLESAARFYRGDLLPACYDDWVLEERSRLRVEAHSALVELAEAAAANEEHEEAVRHAERAVDLEPTGEAATRIQIGSWLALGDRAAAARAYHRHADALAEQLGVEPSNEVTRMYEALVSPHQDTSSGDHASPFVGRGKELHRLRAAWESACEGRARLVLVSGEPGIGKSRLASELAGQVRGEGYAVAASRAYEAAGRLPWGPVVDLLRSSEFDHAIEHLQPAWRGELARLLPELLDDPGPLDRPGDPAERHRLLDAVGRTMLHGDRPLLLVIDDLQWCDAETIELVGFLLRTVASASLLIVGTVRLEEVPDAHPLHGLLAALARDDAVDSLALDPLDEGSTAELATRLRSSDPLDPEVAAKLWAETEGNPLFVIETLRTDLEAMSPTIRAVLAARLGQLSPEARRLAEVAAVVGRSFSEPLLAAASGLDDDVLADGLDELWQRRIVRDQGVGYDFTHDKLRAIALELITPARRRRLHRAVADALTAEYQDDLEAVAPRLAAHFDAAGLVRPAIDAYRTAGARAVEVSALGEAAAAFRRAISLLAELPPSRTRDAEELDLRISLGSPLVAIEGYGSGESHQLYERAMALCRRLRRPVEPPILRGLGLARLQGCRFAECDELGRALLDEQGADPVAATEGRYLLGVSAFWQGDLTVARRHLTAALDGYDESRGHEHLARFAQDPRAVCRVRLAWADLWAGDPDLAISGSEQALQMAVAGDHTMTLWYVTTYAAIVAAEAGDHDRLASLLDREGHLQQRSPERYLAIVLDALRGWLEVTQGTASGVGRIVQSVGRSRADGETLHLTYALLLLARARSALGEIAEGRAAIREALGWTTERGQRYLESELWRIGGDMAYRSGEREEALASHRKAVEMAAAQEAGWLEQQALRALASRFPEEP